jgi:hypothetical protein
VDMNCLRLEGLVRFPSLLGQGETERNGTSQEFEFEGEL